VNILATDKPDVIASYSQLQQLDVTSLSWQEMARLSLKSAAEVARVLNNVYVPPADCAAQFKTTVTPYLLQLMDRDDPNCPIRQQYLPSAHEAEPNEHTVLDELGEEGDTVPGTSIVHRYPRRVLFLVSNQCQSYCRFCTRKRMVAQPGAAVMKDEIEASIDYIARTTTIQDVLLSGGDPMMFSDERLDYILSEIRRRAPHVRFLRIGSRMLVQNPLRITPELRAVLEKNDVHMVNIHINHPKEITQLLKQRLRLLSRSVMLGCQTVCLKGVNDDVQVLRELFMECLTMKVRPYYVYSTDMVEGAHHFIVSHRRMLELYEGLRGWISGPAVPTFVVDGLGGLGKLPVIPEYVREVPQDDGTTTVTCRNYKGATVDMPLLGERK
jgi:lysine 2,3-aminomutase